MGISSVTVNNLKAARALVLLLALGGAACKHAKDEPAPEPAPVRVDVTNHWELAMDVYVEAAGTRHRLGLVAPGIDRTFELPHGLIAAGGRIEFFAAPSSGGQGARSGEIIVSPGDIVEFEITAALFDSHATIRHRGGG